ncbi:hypothetical protein MR857_02680 [bacterium]|nr:hypothetical protein [bacterium]
MRAADRDPAGGEIPVELIHHQPSDDFPQWNRGVEDKLVPHDIKRKQPVK